MLCLKAQAQPTRNPSQEQVGSVGNARLQLPVATGIASTCLVLVGPGLLGRLGIKVCLCVCVILSVRQPSTFALGPQPVNSHVPWLIMSGFGFVLASAWPTVSYV